MHREYRPGRPGRLVGSKPSRTGQVNQTNRLVLAATTWAGDPGDGDRDIRKRMGQRAFGHGYGHFLADRAIEIDQHIGHAEHFVFSFVGIGDEAALDHI